MKLIIGSLILAALVAPSAPLRFEAGGVRVGDALLSGASLELREVGAGSVLASASAVESLASAVTVEVAAGRSLILEPGVRVSRAKGVDHQSFVLSTHAGKALKLTGVAFTVTAPAAFSITDKGWDFGPGMLFAGAEIRASLQQATPPQDTPDADLEAMRRAAKRAQGQGGAPKTASPQHGGKPAGGSVRTHHGDPTVTGQPVDSQAIRQQGSVTPIGFPQ